MQAGATESFKNYYGVLGVLDTAEDVVIKGAYRALAQRYHPDRFEGGVALANQLMAEINEAYLVLSNHDSRRAYDELRVKQPQELADSSMTREIHGFEVEQYRPFALRLAEWGYDMQDIKNALIGRGVRAQIADLLASEARDQQR